MRREKQFNLKIDTYKKSLVEFLNSDFSRIYDVMYLQFYAICTEEENQDFFDHLLDCISINMASPSAVMC